MGETVTLSIRLTDDQKALIAEAAERSHLPLTVYMRMVILKDAEKRIAILRKVQG